MCATGASITHEVLTVLERKEIFYLSIIVLVFYVERDLLLIELPLNPAAIWVDLDSYLKYNLTYRVYFEFCCADNKQSRLKCQVFSLQIYSKTRKGYINNLCVICTPICMTKLRNVRKGFTLQRTLCSPFAPDTVDTGLSHRGFQISRSLKGI